jgi:small neutral amino acid transporter SnatA (MarC family)
LKAGHRLNSGPFGTMGVWGCRSRFLIFGTLLLEIFEVPLSMVRIVGGIILMRIGFSLFMPSAAASSAIASAADGADADIAFVPLAMPLMFGPGAIATVLGMASLLHHPFAEIPSLIAIVAAILATMASLICFSPMPTRSSAPSARAASTRRRASSASSSPRWGWG